MAWLEPRLRPVRRYIVLYVAAAIILNLVFALTDAGKSTLPLKWLYNILRIGFIFPHAILIGLLNRHHLNPIAIRALATHGHHRIFCNPCAVVDNHYADRVTHAVTGQDEHIGSANAAAGCVAKYLCSKWTPLFFGAIQDYKVVEISEAFARDFRMWDPEGVERIRAARINFAPELRAVF